MDVLRGGESEAIVERFCVASFGPMVSSGGGQGVKKKVLRSAPIAPHRSRVCFGAPERAFIAHQKLEIVPRATICRPRAAQEYSAGGKLLGYDFRS